MNDHVSCPKCGSPLVAEGRGGEDRDSGDEIRLDKWRFFHCKECNNYFSVSSD